MPRKTPRVIESENPQTIMRSKQAPVVRQPTRSRRPAPIVTKTPHSRVPMPQVERIKQRHILGQSQREIARAEGRSRPTIARIVKSEEMQAYVQEMRQRFYLLGFDALNAVQHSLQNEKDGRLGRQILVDIGVVQSPQERYESANQPMSLDRSKMTPFQVAVAENENGQIDRFAYRGAVLLEEIQKNWGTSLPSAEEYRHLRKVAKVADKITGGRFGHICFTDGAEEQRIRRLADEMVRAEEARKSLPSRHAQRALPHENRISRS
jgi:hypothetical protein